MDSSTVLIIVILVVAVAGSTALVLWTLVRTGTKRTALLRTGVQARAEITSLDQIGTLNDQPQCRIGLHIEPPSSPPPLTALGKRPYRLPRLSGAPTPGTPFQATATQGVRLTRMPQYQPGQVVTVRYNPTKPSQVTVESVGYVGDTAPDQAREMVARSEALIQRLGNAGTAASALVTAFKPTGVTFHGNDPLAHIDVKVLVRSPFAATIVGVLRESELASYQAGEIVQVRFDPADPREITFDLAQAPVRRRA